LTIEALPLYSAIAATGALVTVARVRRLRRRHLAQGVEVSVDRVADQRRPQAHRIMYIVVALIMLMRGFVDAIMMRAQQAMALNNGG